MRWKLFKKLIAERRVGPFTLYKPQNQKECDYNCRTNNKKNGRIQSNGNIKLWIMFNGILIWI